VDKPLEQLGFCQSPEDFLAVRFRVIGFHPVRDPFDGLAIQDMHELDANMFAVDSSPQPDILRTTRFGRFTYVRVFVRLQPAQRIEFSQ